MNKPWLISCNYATTACGSGWQSMRQIVTGNRLTLILELLNEYIGTMDMQSPYAMRSRS